MLWCFKLFNVYLIFFYNIWKNMPKEKGGLRLDPIISESQAKGEEVALLSLGDSGNEKLPPKSPRGRSHSLIDTTDINALCRTKLMTITEGERSDNTLRPKTCRRSDRRLRKLNSQLLQAVKSGDSHEVQRLLDSGASPNATCYVDHMSASHYAAFIGGESLSLLIKFGAKMFRKDRLGRTPLHLAAWAGNTQEIELLLGNLESFPISQDIPDETIEEIKKESTLSKSLVNARCELDVANIILPKDWRDDIDHNCTNIKHNLPLIYPGSTPLHSASANAQPDCVKLLLDAGSNPSLRDLMGRTPLDIVGSAYYNGHNIDKNHFTEVIKLLLAVDANKYTNIHRRVLPVDTPLHTALEVESLEAVTELLNAGASTTCLNRSGLTPLHLCVKRKLKDHLQVLANRDNSVTDQYLASVDVKDKDGRTVLHSAVLNKWAPGVCACLEAGASITAKANDGETSIHLAAALGELDILNEILTVAKQNNNIDYKNEKGETALFTAIMHGRTECVKKILKYGACIKITLPRQVNVFHVAANLGRCDILKVLLDHDYVVTREIINHLTADDRKGYGPIHFAAWNDHSECVKLLLSNNAYVSLRTSYGLHRLSSPLHIAAMKNHVEIAKILVKFDQTTIHNLDNLRWTPLHTASHHRSREVILFLIREGADISICTDGPNKSKRTSIEMIMDNLSKPTEFMEEVFDTYINSNDLNLQDPNCEVTVDYSMLLANNEDMQQMKVIESVIQTGNRQNQRRLLIHPLIASFLYLKWKALLPFFYTIIVLYGLFVVSMTIFIISVFFYKDTQENKPMWLHVNTWEIIVYITICLLICQEILFVNFSKRYLLQLETWVKFASIVLALGLPSAIADKSSVADWPRHVATLALLLSWVEMMFLLSRFPKWGYYVLMFRKVSSNVLKILFTFVFLIIGFSLSFMIQFRSQIPFESPWAALLKTMVMMTSEFDYSDLIAENKNLNELTTSLVMIRILFLSFQILTVIVLMNLMVGVAVNDLHNLEILGNIRQLEKQVEFLGSLETLVLNKFFSKILPNRLKSNLTLRKVITLRPNDTSSKYYKSLPSHLREAIFDIAQSKKKKNEEQLGSQTFKVKLDEIYQATVKRKEQDDIELNEFSNDTCKLYKNIEHENITRTKFYELDSAVSEMRNEIKLYIKESRTSIEELNVKIDLLLNKLNR